MAKQKGFIADSDVKSIRGVLDEKLKWQRDDLKKIEIEFFTDKCASAAVKLIAFPATVILFSILRWYFM